MLLQQLKTTFDGIIDGIRNDWRHSTLAEHPGIVHYYSEEEHFLISKPYTYIAEDFIINSLTQLFGLQYNEVWCCGNTTDVLGSEYTLVMLWIKKWAFDRVVKTLGIKEIKPQ